MRRIQTFFRLVFFFSSFDIITIMKSASRIGWYNMIYNMYTHVHVDVNVI